MTLTPQERLYAKHLKRTLIPRSWFTKGGPGVEQRAKDAFRALAPWDRRIALEMGWFPSAWRKLSTTWKPAAALASKPEALKKPGLTARLLAPFRRMFGGK